MYGWINVTCAIRKLTLFFLLFMFHITPVPHGFLPLKLQWVLAVEWAVYGSIAQRRFLFSCDLQEGVCALYWRAKWPRGARIALVLLCSVLPCNYRTIQMSGKGESIALLVSFPFPPLSLIFKACCSNPMPSFYRSHNLFRPQKIPSDWDSLDNQLYSLSSFMQY